MKNKTIGMIIIMFFTVILLCAFLLSSCEDFSGSGETLLTISMGNGAASGSAAAGKALPWPKYNPEILKDIIYIVQLESESESKIIEARGTDTISEKVYPGFWSIRIDAYYKSATFHYAYGAEEKFEVIAGQKNTVDIVMYRDYYNIGDYGPGGGIIFYVISPEGFRMADTGEICHYLVFDFPTDAGNWGHNGGYINMPDVGAIGTAIGTGRKNTDTILNSAYGDSAFAALACRARGPEWFLPSIEELQLLYYFNSDIDYYRNPDTWSFDSSVYTISSSTEAGTNDLIKTIEFDGGINPLQINREKYNDSDAWSMRETSGLYIPISAF